MAFNSNSFSDGLSRVYLSVEKVLSAENVKNTETLPGCRQLICDVPETFPAFTLNPGGVLVLDFGREIAGGIRIVNLGMGGKIEVTFGESVTEALGMPDDCHAVHRTTLDVSRMSVLDYGNTGFRFVRLQNRGDGKLDLVNVLAILRFRDLPRIGKFESSDAALNRIWEVCSDTIQLNMQEYLFDGIKRDRLVWQGDLFSEMKSSSVIFDDVSIIGKSLDFLRDHTFPGNEINAIASYSLWYVMTLEEYFLRTGNFAFLESHRDRIFEILDRAAGWVAPDGTERIPGRRFLDWKTVDEPDAARAGLAGILCRTMKSGAHLCRIFGVSPDLFREKYLAMRKNAPSDFGNKSAAAMLSFAGLSVSSCAETLTSRPREGWSTFFSYFMFSAMPTLPALEALKTYYGGMLDRGATSFWEDFDLSWLENSGRIDAFPVPGLKDLHADFGNHCYKGLRHSFCHGWAAGPAAFLSERILGVRYASPGGSKITFSPDLGNLDFVSGTIPTPQGPVQVRCERGQKTEIKLPAACEIVSRDFFHQSDEEL